MHNTTAPSSDRSIYWPLIRRASVEEKLRLIVLLSESVTSDLREPKESSAERTKRFIDKFGGAWKGDASAEEIIEAIRSERTNRAPVSFDL